MDNAVSRPVSRDFAAMLEGYSLTTAEILYRLPDHPALIQAYIWQDYDLSPRFPKLKQFLEFWTAKLDGKLFKVIVGHRQLIQPSEIRHLNAQYGLH